MGRTPSSPPPAGFSEHEVPTRVRATLAMSTLEEREAATGTDGRPALERAMGQALDSKTTAVPVDMLEAALAESRSPFDPVREEKSGARKRTVEREAFSVHEAETKRASTIEVRKAALADDLVASSDSAAAPSPTPAAPTPTEPPLGRPLASEPPPPKSRALAKSLVALLLFALAATGACAVLGHGNPLAGAKLARQKVASLR